MDVDESDAAGGGGSGSGGQGKAARGPDAGAATAEGVELLQVSLQQQQQLNILSMVKSILLCRAAAAAEPNGCCLASTSHRVFLYFCHSCWASVFVFQAFLSLCLWEFRRMHTKYNCTLHSNVPSLRQWSLYKVVVVPISCRPNRVVQIE